MTTLLFSVLAATSLAVAGAGAPTETRSAQSLPNDHLVTAATNSASSGKFQTTNRLVDAMGNDEVGGDSERKKCTRKGGHWDKKKLRCLIVWPVPLIGAATTAGLIYALSSHDHLPAYQPPISN